MKVVIAGSRGIKNYQFTKRIIEHRFKKHNIFPIRIGCGEAPGVDTHGENWAKEKGIPIEYFPAKWDDLTTPGAIIKTNSLGKKYNARAGSDRNALMAEWGEWFLIIWDGQSPGSKDMMNQAKRLNKPGVCVTLKGEDND